MLPFRSLINFGERKNMPIFQFIANHLITLIRQGKILPGSSLPATREMAILIEVHRNTITKAYNELRAQGWVDAIHRKGFVVRSDLPISKPRSYPLEIKYYSDPVIPEKASIYIPKGFNFIPQKLYPGSIFIDDGFPDIRLAPIKELLKGYQNIIDRKSVKELSFANSLGDSRLAYSTADMLNKTRGLNTRSENILITRGAQMAIYLAAAILLKEGDEIVVGEPGYFMANSVFRQFGVKINFLPIDEDGIDVDRIEDLLRKKNIKLLYLIPHHHHPTTVTLSFSRRIQLLKLIQRYRIWVIEDDYDYDFQYQEGHILPLASNDKSGQVIYIGSYSKILTPSIRIGFMVASTQLIERAITLQKLIDFGGDVAMESSLASLIDRGDLSRHVNRSLKIYKHRFENTSKLINSELRHIISFRKPLGGMALWLKFEDSYPLSKILLKLAKSGVVISGTTYYKDAYKHYNHIRFGFASLTDNELQNVIEVFKKVISKS
ncbi:PLP-dependent aminotransferase family protein [Pedobacter ginsengiterrae]|uniref:PLP-dependent aminotransferase family protein n=1 Tax=Pedobacter ginsengiterrae TaxID=871696 RepID=A0ABP7P2Z1_9SPHI